MCVIHHHEWQITTTQLLHVLQAASALSSQAEQMRQEVARFLVDVRAA